jgi:3-hydroxyisobutyrate dehydrogenase-like beta-hydroxyacid dehydrogenase
MLRKIGFIGLGTVGRHMAVNLAKANYELTVFDYDATIVGDVTAAGARSSSSAFEAAKGRDLVIAIVPEGDELGSLFFGEQGIMAGIDSGTILADMGSHSLETTMKLAEECAKKNVHYLDAPVWGSKDHAVNGLMTIITGGDPALAGRCREPFSYFGLNTIHVGQVGDATKMKFIVNLVQAELVQVLAEGLVFGEKMGFNADKILEVLDTRGVASPLFHRKDALWHEATSPEVLLSNMSTTNCIW